MHFKSATSMSGVCFWFFLFFFLMQIQTLILTEIMPTLLQSLTILFWIIMKFKLFFISTGMCFLVLKTSLRCWFFLCIDKRNCQFHQRIWPKNIIVLKREFVNTEKKTLLLFWSLSRPIPQWISQLPVLQCQQLWTRNVQIPRK